MKPVKSKVMSDTMHYDKKQAEFRAFVAQAYDELMDLKAAGKTEAFNEKLLAVLPEVKRYLTRGLRLALKAGVISHNKYRPDDLFDQLYLEVYDHLEEVPKAEEFHPWIFKRAEKLLGDMEMQEIFNSYQYESLDRFSRAERSSMDESFSTDGDGDLVLLEELDEISYEDGKYLLRNVFLDDAHEDLMALMESDTGRKKAERHLDTVLFTLPAPMRSVFELANEQGFTTTEIARIKKQTEEEVEALLEAARQRMRESLTRRLF